MRCGAGWVIALLMLAIGAQAADPAPGDAASTPPPGDSRGSGAMTEEGGVAPDGPASGHVERSQKSPTPHHVDRSQDSPTPRHVDRNEGSLVGTGAATAPTVRQREKPELALEQLEPRQLLVLHTSMEEALAFASWLEDSGYLVRSRESLAQLAVVQSVVQIPPGIDLGEAIAALEGQLPDLTVAPNHRYRLQARAARDWGRAATRWGSRDERCGAGRHIGLLDTLPDLSHPALRGARVEAHTVLPSGVTAAPPEHATAIAGLLVGRAPAEGFTGLVPAARLSVVGAFRVRDGGEVDATTDRLTVALEWLLGQGVEIVNLSFTGPGNRVFERLLTTAHEHGVALVAAAGNAGPGAPPPFPAALAFVIGVTAVDAEDEIYREATPGPHVEFAAPGVDLWLPRVGGGGRFFSGSSFASPWVAAALARDGTRGHEARRLLQRSARDLGPAGYDAATGFGMLQPGSSCTPP